MKEKGIKSFFWTYYKLNRNVQILSASWYAGYKRPAFKYYPLIRVRDIKDECLNCPFRGILFRRVMMKVELGNVYFIKQSFFDLVQDSTLPINKPTKNGILHHRPAFCAIRSDEGDYYWVIPLSSQVEKYRKIHDQALLKYGRCDTIEFGYVLGNECAFLIQNMFPVTEDYFQNIYIDKSTNKPVVLSKKLKKSLKSKANKVISLYKRKNIMLMFTDVEKIFKKLDIK